MHEFLQDLRYGMRTLRNSPGFTAVALATLAIGIGANTAIFSFVDGVLLKPLPYPEPGRIVRVLEKPPGGGRNGISTLNYLDWQKDNTVFDYMAAQTGGSTTLTGNGEPAQLRASRSRRTISISSASGPCSAGPLPATRTRPARTMLPF